MRLLNMTLVLCALFLGMTPVRAEAWFGFLDRISGPGRFYGEMYDFRLACFGRSYPGQVLADRLFELELLEVELADMLAAPSDASTLDLARIAWQGLVNAASASAIPRLQVLSRRVVNVTADDMGARYGPRPITTAKGAEPEAQAALTRMRLAALEELRANMAANSVGVLWSFCGNDKTRSVSIDMAVDFWWTKGVPEYAGEHSIRLLMLMPSLSWWVIKKPSHDVLGLSAGGGMYAFSSRGFNDFTGVVLQPVRLSLHFPSDWTKQNVRTWRGFLSLFNGHYGVYAFPAGFEPNAFNGVGPKDVRIPVELVQTFSVFVNWQSRALRWNLH